jgi:hypothetical protein
VHAVIASTVSGPPEPIHFDIQRIPTDIPPIDLSAPVTAADFNERRATTPTCVGTCGSGSITGDTASSPFLVRL